MENGTEVAVVGEGTFPLTANAVVARVRLIQEVMGKVMKENTHYGIIPGCGKPSLWKPGAEQLLVTFRIAPDEPKVEDLSTSDSIRYRVTRTGKSNGFTVAAGVGEASSDEEKYKWRNPVCDAEFDATPEDRRRLKWKRDGTSYKQVRTNPADLANTILKMADKRAFVAMALLATAASDIFTQDIEDLPPEVAEAIASDGPKREPTREPIQEPKRKSEGEELVTEFVPTEYDAKNGTSAKTGKPWVKHGVKDAAGKWYGSFSEEIGEVMAQAAEQKRKLHLVYIADGKYNNVRKAVMA